MDAMRERAVSERVDHGPGIEAAVAAAERRAYLYDCPASFRGGVAEIVRILAASNDGNATAVRALTTPGAR